MKHKDLEKILQEYSFKEILTKVKNFGNDPKKTEKVATHAKKAIDHMAHNLGFISTDSLKKDYKSKKVDFGMVKRSAENQPEMSDVQAMSSGIKSRYKKGFGGEHIVKQEKENQILKDKKIRNHPAQNLEVGKERAGQAEINRRKELYSKPYKATAREDRQVDANFAKWTSKKNKPTIESIVDKYLASLDEDSRRRSKEDAYNRRSKFKPMDFPIQMDKRKGLRDEFGKLTAKGAFKQSDAHGRSANQPSKNTPDEGFLDNTGDYQQQHTLMYSTKSKKYADIAMKLSPNRPKKKGDIETLTRGAVKESTLEGVVSNFLEGENQQSRARQLQRRIDSKKRKTEIGYDKNPGLPKAEYRKERVLARQMALQDMKDANVYQPGSPPPSRDKLIPFKNPSKPKPSQQDRARQLQALRKKEVVEGTNTIVANFAKVRQAAAPKKKQETSPSIAYLVNKLSGAPKSKLAPGSEAPNNPERVSSKIDRGVPFATQTASRLLRGDSGERQAASSYLDKPTFQRNKMSPKEQTDMLRGAINKYVKKEESVLGEDDNTKYFARYASKAGRKYNKENSKNYESLPKYPVDGERDYEDKHIEDTKSSVDANKQKHKGEARLAALFSLMRSPNRPRKKGDIETLTRGAVKEKAIIDNFLSNLAEADHKKYKKGFEKQGAQTRATNAKMVHHGEMEPTKSKYKQGKLTPKGEYKLKQSKEREDKKYNAQHPEQVVKETVQTEDTLTGDVAIMPMPFKAVGMLKDLHKKKKKHKKGIIAAMMGAATTGS